MSRGKRVYLPVADAEAIARLAIETEDRSHDEQRALERMCVKLDRLGQPCLESQTWLTYARATLEPCDHITGEPPVERPNGEIVCVRCLTPVARVIADDEP